MTSSTPDFEQEARDVLYLDQEIAAFARRMYLAGLERAAEIAHTPGAYKREVQLAIRAEIERVKG